MRFGLHKGDARQVDVVFIRLAMPFLEIISYSLHLPQENTNEVISILFLFGSSSKRKEGITI